MDHLIDFDPDMSEREVALSYEGAATRLAASYSGKPDDDLILMPLLFLWRQAIELTLKATIRELCALRRKQGDSDPGLLPEKVDHKLRKKIRHSISELTIELGQQLQAAGADALPEDVLDTLDFFAEIDNAGTGFRYANVLESQAARTNFITLNDRLKDTALLLTATIDVVTSGQGVRPSWSACRRSCRRPHRGRATSRSVDLSGLQVGHSE